jgi:glycosyltransferase involved in cell wall biosynthesis
VRRIVRGGNYLRHSLQLRAFLLWEIFRHKHIFTNGLEHATYRACQLLKHSYVLKVVGDVAWELARNRGWTELSIDEFQKAPVTNTSWQEIAEHRIKFSQGARKVITPSCYLRGIVMQWGVPEQNINVVYNGMPFSEYSQYLPQQRNNGPLKLIYIGRLVNWKGVDTLLKALREVSHVELTIVGDGPQMPELKELARDIAITCKVHFAGLQNKAGVKKYLAQSHALVLVSSYEGLSHTLIEACAMGVPCIASASGGNPEVIQDGENGFLVPYGDVEALRAAIEKLQRDEELRYRMACKAKESSRQFDFDETVRRTAAIITGQNA